jgi:hypothetical protein
VGHTKEKLVDSVIRKSIKQFPVHRVILLIGKDLNVSREEAVYETAKETAKELKGFAAYIVHSSPFINLKTILTTETQ